MSLCCVSSLVPGAKWLYSHQIQYLGTDDTDMSGTSQSAEDALDTGYLLHVMDICNQRNIYIYSDTCICYS